MLVSCYLELSQERMVSEFIGIYQSDSPNQITGANQSRYSDFEFEMADSLKSAMLSQC